MCTKHWFGNINSSFIVATHTDETSHFCEQNFAAFDLISFATFKALIKKFKRCVLARLVDMASECLEHNTKIGRTQYTTHLKLIKINLIKGNVPRKMAFLLSSFHSSHRQAHTESLCCAFRAVSRTNERPGMARPPPFRFRST